jgi:hypothetical protein
MISLEEDGIVIRKLSYILVLPDYWTLGLRRGEMGSIARNTIFVGFADADRNSLLAESKIFAYRQHPDYF